jgi:hypothetical protein
MYIANIGLLRKTLTEISVDNSIKSLLLFCGDYEKPAPDELCEVLKCNNKPLIGGIFPAIIANGERKQSGFMLIPLDETITTGLFQSQDSTTDIAVLFNKWVNENNTAAASIFCFFDGMWSSKTRFMCELYDYFGPFVNYMGGGAGSLSFKSFPCIFANHRVVENAAVIGLFPHPLKIGVAHGWEPVSEPIKVTEARGNSIVTLNWRPAFEVYSELIKLYSGKILSEKFFFNTSIYYPLGLVQLDSEMIIRVLYSTEDGVLHALDEVPQGEYVRIMNGSSESLLQSARRALAESELSGNNEESERLCIESISRILYHEDDVSKELELLNRKNSVNGILSIGQIANPGNTSLKLFNKTIAVAQWKKTN